MREWLKELRHEKKLTQKEAARILGIGASTYSIPISYVFEHELKSDCVKK